MMEKKKKNSFEVLFMNKYAFNFLSVHPAGGIGMLLLQLLQTQSRQMYCT